jgi:molecular chaperone DnaK
VLVDVTPYTFGTSALGYFQWRNVSLLLRAADPQEHADSGLRSEGFCTIFDGQSKVDINVYQGEDPDALNNIEIGRFTIEGLRDAPAGNPLITTFSLDVNGILQVTSREKETGLVHSITIDNAISRFTGDKLLAARERIDELFGEQENAIEAVKDGLGGSDEQLRTPTDALADLLYYLDA